WASNVVTISGTSSVAGSFPYTVTLTGGCGAVTATGTITITPANTVTLSSGTGTNNQTKCINTALDNITFSTTGATGATFSGLPTGVSGAWASNVVTISGTSSVTGSFPYTVSLTGGCGTVTATGTIIIDVLPVITTQPHSLAICQGQNGSFNVVTTAATPTYQWQYSLSLSGPWTATNTATGVTGHNTATLSLTNVPNNYSNYYMRCIVTSNTCNTISDAVLLTVNPLPSTPTVSTTNVSCTATGSVTLGNLPASGTWTLERSPGLITTTGTGTTTTITGLAVGTYTFRVSNGTCSSAVSADAVITDQSSTTWNGSSWSPAAPDATRAAIIAGPFTVSADLTACSLTINSGIDIVVPSNFTLKIINGLTVSPTSKLTFENHSSLVQVNNNAVNSGKITYKRTAVQIRQADYTYWSTPVSPQRLIDVSPASSYNKFFGYSGTAWVATYPTGNMVVGKGYIIRGPDTFSNTAKADYTASFSGVPNNGILTGETMQADKFYLIGNPYPSALDADTFIDENRFLEGTLYFWTHNTPVVLSAAYRYSSTDYASYNLTGGVGSQPAPSGNPSNNDDKPSGFIGAGQSFFASAATPGTITFNNGMRLGATQNTQFFKSASKAAKIEKHRIWLNITNTEGAFKQMLVGYVQGASNEYEARYDGVSFDANPYIDFYSVANGNNYVIQARALPFANTDLVPLGYRTTIAGEFTIAIDQTDGDLKNQAIYLEDKTTGVIYDLTAGNYKFTTAKGTFSDRFVLRYTNKTLGTGDFEDTQNGLLVSVKQKNIKVTSAIENIKEVTIYDVAGKMLYNKNKAATTELQIQNLPSANQVLLVKITLENNFTTTKKIIFN
ncbi:T9SS sorting signal type C domain-containing protein, partial [Pseudomonas shirazensis]